MTAPVIINPNFYQISLAEVNAFVFKSEAGLILIDTGTPGSKDQIFRAVRNIGYEPEDIKHIIVTHAHYDHSGSLADILKEINAIVYMHPADAELVRKGIAHSFRSKRINSLVNTITIGSPIKLPRLNIKPVTEITAVKDGEWIPNNTGLQVIYAPGHCRGQIALYSPQNNGIIIAADIAENIEHLKLTPKYHNLHRCMATIKRISLMDFRVALFSHGSPILHNASNIFKDAFGFD
jgi:glyoxylase-like metal-dependent hydrolase (beta-lactamase superfamily II)